MFNLDKANEKKLKIQNELACAIRENDEGRMTAAMDDWQQFVSDAIMAEAGSMVEATDRSILAARGVRQLTAQETEFYQKLISTGLSDARASVSIDGIMDDLPETVFDQVLEDMQEAHPLLSSIDFVNTGAAIKWVINAQGAQSATWDELNTEITKEMSGAIEVSNMTLAKLTALMYVTKDMLRLGPAWVDRYVRTVLSEAHATGLELAIVDGNGIKKPIGMTRDFRKPFDAEGDGYPRKESISVGTFTPEVYGKLLARISKSERTGNSRTIRECILVVNPLDYFTKVMPATTMLTPDGHYVSDVLPFPTRVIQSVGVPENHAVIGVGAWYFMGIGSGTSGTIEYDDSYKFAEDLRTYITRFYGNGKPKDNNCFLYLDITALHAPMPGEISYTAAYEDAGIASLTIGALELTPAFDKDVTEYTATATKAFDPVLVIPKDGNADVIITAGETVVTNGNSANWTNNAVTTLTVKVYNGAAKKEYTIAVTRGTVN